MEPTTKKRLEIALAIVLVVGVIILLIIFLAPRGADDPIEEDPSQESQLPTDRSGPEFQPADVPDGPIAVDPQTTVRVFVERFGSFSSESGYVNIDDILAVATSSLQTRLQQLAVSARENDGSYYGVSTRIISLNEISRTDEAVVYDVTTQREEAIGAPDNTSVRYQDITVTLVPNNLDWLVDDFEWSE